MRPRTMTFISRTLATAIGVALLHSTLAASGPDVFRYNGGRSDRASGIAVDATGSWYVPGSVEPADGSSSFAVVKHRPNGSVEWVARYTGAAGRTNGTAVAAAVDQAGNVYAAGYVFNGGTSTGALDYLIVKFDASGVQRWAVLYDGPGHNYDVATRLAVDAAGRVYVTGRSYGSSFDWATLRISSSGTVDWVRRFDSPLSGSDDEPVDLQLDATGNAIVMGRAANGSGAFGNDVGLVKYDANGQVVWQTAFTFTAQSDDIAADMALDGADNVLVTGQTSATPSPEQPVFAFLLKFDSGGQLEFSLADAAAGGSAVTTDSQGSIYVTGTSAPEFATPYTAISKFASTGSLVWTTPIADTASTSVGLYRIVVDAAGAAYAGGVAVDRSFSTRDFLTIKLAAAGTPLWQHRFNGVASGNDEVAALALDVNENLLVTGTTWGGYVSSGGTAEDIATLKFIKNSLPASTKPQAPANLAVQSATAAQVALRWDDRSTDESGFRIERCAGSKCTNFAMVSNVASGATTYRDTVAKNTTYSYRVLAFNDAGLSTASNIVTVQTPKK